MKKLLLLSLVVFGLVVVPAAQAKFHWNVKCQKFHIKGYKLRKGIDCAHVLTKGKTWKFPKGTNSARMFTPAGKILAIKFLGMSKGTPLYSIGPGGKYGKVLEGEAPLWVKSFKAMVVLAATKSIPLQQPVISDTGGGGSGGGTPLPKCTVHADPPAPFTETSVDGDGNNVTESGADLTTHVSCDKAYTGLLVSMYTFATGYSPNLTVSGASAVVKQHTVCSDDPLATTFPLSMQAELFWNDPQKGEAIVGKSTSTPGAITC